MSATGEGLSPQDPSALNGNVAVENVIQLHGAALIVNPEQATEPLDETIIPGGGDFEPDSMQLITMIDPSSDNGDLQVGLFLDQKALWGGETGDNRVLRPYVLERDASGGFKVVGGIPADQNGEYQVGRELLSNVGILARSKVGNVSRSHLTIAPIRQAGKSETGFQVYIEDHSTNGSTIRKKGEAVKVKINRDL